MFSTLLLDFSTKDGAYIGNLVWQAAFVLWIPQLLAIWLVLRPNPRSLANKLVLVMLPLVLTGLAVAELWFFSFILLMYADVHWGWWLFTLVLPTVAGLIAVKVNHRQTPEEAAAQLKPPKVPMSLPEKIVGIVFVGLLVQAWSNRPTEISEGKTRHWTPPDRATRARNDSIQASNNEARTRAEFDSLERLMH